MIRPMHLLVFSDILGLGEAPSSFGQSLALILTFFVVLGGVANVLIAYTIGQVMVERKQNIVRRHTYDDAHQQ
jgi:hypothetical protein